MFAKKFGLFLVEGTADSLTMRDEDLQYMGDRVGIEEEIKTLDIKAIQGDDNEEDYATRLPKGRFFLTRIGGGNYSKSEFLDSLSLLRKEGIVPIKIFLTASCCMQCNDLSYAFEISEKDIRKIQQN